MAMIYTASGETSSFTTARTVMYLTVPADALVELISCFVGAPDNDINEQIHLRWQNISSLGTPTATAVTPSEHELGQPASGVTAALDVTASEPTYAANTSLYEQSAPSLSGYRLSLHADERPRFSPSSNWGLRLIANMDTAKTLVVRVTWAELGG